MTEAVPGPLTTLVRRAVRPGCEAAYEDWLRDTIAAARGFPGHLGATVLRPSGPGGVYTLLFTFATPQTLAAWEGSDIRAAAVRRADPLCLRPALAARMEGITPWFTLDGAAPPQPPPRWKMAVVSWLAAFPLIEGLTRLLPPVLGWLPPEARVGVVTATMIATMTWVVMPAMTRLFARWLFGAAR